MVKVVKELTAQDIRRAVKVLRTMKHEGHILVPYEMFKAMMQYHLKKNAKKTQTK